MTKAERITRIIKLMGAIKQTPLSKKCGKYVRLLLDETKTKMPYNTVLVRTKNDFVLINELPSKVITQIFNDLKVDFSLL